MTVAEAAEAIRAGELVAFPTETVYGLGANALDAAAVARIFEVKGRPSTSPLIVHVASIEMARELTREWPDEAEILAQEFWPGPLTLVLPKRSSIPDIVTAGLDSVGIRIPAHSLALEFLRAAGVPVAAPSANRFTELSPTSADHVRQSLGARVKSILDGGPCTVGIESTVLSLVRGPELLRPGMISRERIEALIGPVREGGQPAAGPHTSPGQHTMHYRPATPLFLVDDARLPERGSGVYLWLRTNLSGEHVEVAMPRDPEAYAARLYRALHDADALSLDWIAVETPPEEPAWLGILDRLKRARTHGILANPSATK